MSQNFFVYAADISKILLSRAGTAGTGFGGAAAETCTGTAKENLKIAEISADTVSYEVARMLLKKKILFLSLNLFFSMVAI